MISSQYKPLLDKYASSLLGAVTYKQNVSVVRQFFEWLRTRAINAETIRSYQKYLRNKPKDYSSGTIKKHVEVLHRMCVVNGVEWPLKRGENPVVNEMDVYAPRLDPRDIHTMIKIVRGQLPSPTITPTAVHRAFLCLSTTWGLRRGEIVEITPEMVEKKTGLVFIRTEKHGRQRYHTVPDFIWPYLEEWNFRYLTPNKVSQIFGEFKDMLGFTGTLADGVGWHAIRRSLVKELEVAGIIPSDISSFLRWKRSSRDMESRYATTVMVGTRTTEMDLGREDRDSDARVLDKHPFLPWWK